MNKPKVTIGVILYKDTKYLAHSLTSLLDQDYPAIEYIIRDQSPNGEVYHYIKEAHPEFLKQAKVKKGENLMHSGGHNAMIREMEGEYYICASNDMLYPKDFVSRIIAGMEGSSPRRYVATCKLMQWHYEKMLAGNKEGSKTGIVDSYGISLTKSHHFYDIGQGKEESEVEIPAKMLGPSGALAVYHKRALEAVRFRNEQGKVEYFDELLHYKNDVDLAYRLSWAGFPCYLAKDVKVYHDRQLGERGSGALAKLKDHHQKADWAKLSSLKGHLVTIEKNFDPDFSWGVKFRTHFNLGLRLYYALTFHPKSFTVYREVRQLKDKIEARKRAIRKEVSPKDIEAIMS